MTSVDLNADLGEYQDAREKSRERELLSIVSSCNIACGGHAGNEETIIETLQAAIEHEVAIGAHPSYPDRENFGRRSLFIPIGELQESLREQLSLFERALLSCGATLNHIKPHGALYNDMMQSEELSDAFLEIARETFPRAKVYGLPNSILMAKCQGQGIVFVSEAFADRRYREDGALVPRSEEGAVLSNIEERVAQAIALASGKNILTSTGAQLALNAKTICLHGDDDEAIETARKISDAFSAREIIIRSCN